jgi:hypothetical protein
MFKISVEGEGIVLNVSALSGFKENNLKPSYLKHKNRDESHQRLKTGLRIFNDVLIACLYERFLRGFNVANQNKWLA